MADSPVQTDITIIQGETKVFSATWTVDGSPKSLEGYAGHLQVRKRPGKYTTSPLIDVSSEGESPGITIEPGGTTGKVGVRITAQLTATLAKDAWYDLFVVNLSDTSDTFRLMFGQVSVSLSATDNSVFDAVVDSSSIEEHVVVATEAGG